MFNGPTRSALPCPAPSEAFPHGRLDERRVGLAAGRLHDLADEEADGLRLAGPVVGDGRRVGGQDGVDRGRPTAPPSEIWRKPRAAMIAAAVSPVATCASRTSRPCAREIDPVADRLDDRAELGRRDRDRRRTPRCAAAGTPR